MFLLQYEFTSLKSTSKWILKAIKPSSDVLCQRIRRWKFHVLSFYCFYSLFVYDLKSLCELLLNSTSEYIQFELEYDPFEYESVIPEIEFITLGMILYNVLYDDDDILRNDFKL